MYNLLKSIIQKRTIPIKIRVRFNRIFIVHLLVFLDTAVLVVEIEDVNDNPPTFFPTYFEASIIGGIRREQYVTTVNATDPDQSPNGAPFTFTLNLLKDKFQLKNPTSKTVDLYTTLHEFSREMRPLYQVSVTAADAGSPAQSSEFMIFVHVLDDTSNQEAHDGTMKIIIYALDGRFPGGVIGDVYYKDDDYQVDLNNYVIIAQEPGNYFSVDFNTGRLSCVADIPVDVYSINITVRERNSRMTVQSEVSVSVRSIRANAVQHAVALKFPLRNAAVFIDVLYMKLAAFLGELFRVSAEHVYVFDVAQSSGAVANSPYGVDVWIAIQHNNGDFLKAHDVFAELETNYVKIVGLGKFSYE